MEDPVTTQVLISIVTIVLTVISVVIVVNKGTAENARQTGMILQSIKSIQENISELKIDMKDNATRLSSIESRLTKVETYVSNDDQRIKTLEERTRA
jgi:septal ring factor EnvC (AmiA/AmiB activator)